MTILYADDDSDDCELLVEALGKIDPTIECRMANDGKQALKVLDESDNLPDYIFLDVNMPVMDGKDCLVELKKDNRYKEIPVVIYSTTKDLNEITSLYELGAVDFLAKPNSFEELYRSLDRMINRLKSESC